MALVEGTNVSVGRGTDTPFEVMGAPWIDPKTLSGTLVLVHVTNMPSYLARTIYYSPADGKNLIVAGPTANVLFARHPASAPRVHRFGGRDQPGMMGEMQFARLRLELTASVAPSPLDNIR